MQAALQSDQFDPLDCVRTVENAYSAEGGLSILYGSLARYTAWATTASVGIVLKC